MPNKPGRPCTRCGKRVVKNGLCRQHLSESYRHADSKRGTAAERGYSSEGHRAFRDAVLLGNLYRCCWPDCHQQATVADHYPKSRKQLIAEGLDPNDPRYGRALCEHHHNVWTGHNEGADNLRKSKYK